MGRKCRRARRISVEVIFGRDTTCGGLRPRSDLSARPAALTTVAWDLPEKSGFGVYTRRESAWEKSLLAVDAGWKK